MNAKWAVCASGLFLLVFVGCKSFDAAGFFAAQSDGSGREQVVAGSLDVIAQSTQAKLTQLGFEAVKSSEGDTVRIACKNSSGLKFSVVLSKDAAAATASAEASQDRTKVRFEWVDGSDQQVALTVFSHLSGRQR